MFTHSEKTIRNRTVGQAVTAATLILKERYKNNTLCTNALKKLDYSDAITLEELNRIQSQLIADTLYYS